MKEKSKALTMLGWFCPNHLIESIAGDLEQQFEEDIDRYGLKIAKRKLYWNVLRFFRPSIILKNKFSPLMQTNMLANYVKVASRNIMKRKLYSFINAFGLSIAIAFGILIYLFIEDERSFDQFHEKKDELYIMSSNSFNTWDEAPEQRFNISPWLQPAMRQALLDDVPQVEMATRFNPDNYGLFKYNDKVFNENVAYVDHDFFEMFSFRLLRGNAKKLFTDNKLQIVLTPPIVEKYFGDEDPMGKTILLDFGGEKAFSVAGVIESPPANSSFDFKMLVPQENRPGYERNLSRWTTWNTPTFVQLAKGADLKDFSLNLEKLVEKHLSDNLAKRKRESVVQIPDGTKIEEYTFTRLQDLHLHKEIGWTRASDRQYSWILAGIALLILLIACINYISLALTTSASRRTEVGIRKVAGAYKKQLMYQFGFESVFLALISMVCGIGLAVVFLPSFNQFTGKGISLSTQMFLKIVPYALVGSLFIGLVAGSYPAWFLSGFKPVAVLKGRFTSKLQAGFTKPLVVMQFALAAFLIISSLVMFRQMEYVTSKDLGFAKDQVIVIPTQAGWSKASDQAVVRFRTKLQQNPGVLGVAGVSSSFNRGSNRFGYKIKGEFKDAYVYGVDPNYISLLGMTILEGRNFDERIAADSNAVVVNEALVRDMKWKDPLTEHLNYLEDSTSLGAKVIGVVKDFHFQSLEKEIEPMLLSVQTHRVGHLENILVKVAAGDLPASVDFLRDAWNDITPNLPFEYTFMDDDISKQYESYQRWMNIMGFSTGFAILISCMGLFGLSGVNAINRTKEIGIRKVMGAQLMSIVLLLNKQYVWLAAIAFAIAAPASWYIMSQWLADFKFSIEIGWELLVVSMAAGLAISLATVSYHAIRAALLNPADTLKHE
ncbi:MAG: ABC transporter permease [Chryseolinea sp.]